MKNFFTYIVNLLSVDPRKPEMDYLNESVDIVDVERRIRQIEKGEAPFQKRYPYPI